MFTSRSTILFLLITTLSSCKFPQPSQNAESSANSTTTSNQLPQVAIPSIGNNQKIHPMVEARVGVSTEHPLSGVGNSRDVATACRITRDEVAKMHKQGIYYAAVKGKFYKGQEGAYCGQKFKLTIGGACFYNHNKNCLEPEGHGSFEEISKAHGNKPFKGSRSVTVFIADICGSCIDDALHVDITGDAFLPGGPLHDAKKYFSQYRLTNSNGKTTEENNLYIEKVEHLADCVDFVKLMAPTAPVWGIPSGPCAKMPSQPSGFIMPFQMP